VLKLKLILYNLIDFVSTGTC